MKLKSRMILRAFVCLMAMTLTSCFSYDKYNVSEYKKTLNHIKTHMFEWSKVRGGIYWIDDEHLLLEAYITDKKGSRDRGLYQVNVVTESFEKIVDIPDSGDTFFNYCFNGKILHVMVEKGNYIQASQPDSYEVLIRSKGKKNRTNRYSKLRCGFVELPQLERTAYLPLKTEDGLIKNDATFEDNVVRVFLASNEGIGTRQIPDERLDSRGLIGLRSYVPHLNAYFGITAFKDDCTFVSHLYRANWKLEQEELCIKDWAFGGKLINRLSDAFYVEHHTNEGNAPKHYVLVDDLTISLGTTDVRGASVSPDGCMVAYGDGDGTFGKSIPRQKLTIFNFCEFSENELAK